MKRLCKYQIFIFNIKHILFSFGLNFNFTNNIIIIFNIIKSDIIVKNDDGQEVLKRIILFAPMYKENDKLPTFDLM